VIKYQSEVMKYEIEIDLSRDSLLHENSISLFKKSYLQKNLGETSPQHRYACIASVLGSNQEHAQRLYEWMSKLYLSPSTPMALMNPLNRGHLPASCFLTCVEDTREGLVSSLLEDAYLSMSGGGIGQYFDTRSADDKSTGKKPHISVLNNLIDAYKQASRRGAVAIYLDITDSEIESFIGLRDPKKSKDLNLHHGVNITDDFMRAVINGEKVELKCNKKGTVTGVVDATELLCRILEMRAKFGEPYIHFIDTSNRLMPDFQKKQGLKIKQSNLCCVTGDTKAKTNFGDIRVDALVGYDNIKYYSPTLEDYVTPKVPMTLISTNSKVYRVTLSDGKYIDVTEEHKHPILDGCEERLVTTKELLEMRTEYADMPAQSVSRHPRYLMSPVDKVLLRVDYVGGHTWGIKKDYNDDTILASYMPIQYIQELDEQPVYCLTMPTEDTLWVANKICTGNSEITLPTGDGRTAVCFLSSLNLTHYDEIRANPQIIHDSIEMIDNAISLFISELEADLDEYKKTVGTEDERGHRGYAMRKALKGAKEERAIGLGVLGYHDYFQSKEIPIESPLCAGYTNSMFKYIREEAEVITKKLAEEKGSCPDAERMGIVRRNSHVLAVAPNACVKSDTKIQTVEGTLSYSDIFKSRGIDEKIIVEENAIGWHEFNSLLEVTNVNGDPSKTRRVYYTGNVPVIRFELEDGTFIECTENHKLLAFSGGGVKWVKAKCLKNGTTLITNDNLYDILNKIKTGVGMSTALKLLLEHNIVIDTRKITKFNGVSFNLSSLFEKCEKYGVESKHVLGRLFKVKKEYAHLIKNFPSEEFLDFTKKYPQVSSSRDYMFNLYGVDIYDKVKNQPNMYSIEFQMSRFGITLEDAKKKIESIKKKTAGNLESFISRHGEALGVQLYYDFCNNSKHTVDNYKKWYGEDWESKWEYVQERRRVSSTYDGYLERFPNATYEEYKKYTKSFGASLSTYLGKDKKHGLDRYLKNRRKPKQSKQAMDILDEVKRIIGERYSLIYNGNPEELLVINKDKAINYDLYIPEINLIIDIHGYKYHAYPNFSGDKDAPYLIYKKSNSKTWNNLKEKDDHVAKFARDCGYNYEVVWMEKNNSSKSVKQKAVLEIIEKIERYANENSIQKAS
jgi:ribonucleotide reductase alpha subunit